MTKAPAPTEKFKKQQYNTKTLPKTSITQRLRTDLGRSFGVTLTNLGTQAKDALNNWNFDRRGPNPKGSLQYEHGNEIGDYKMSAGQETWRQWRHGVLLQTTSGPG